MFSSFFVKFLTYLKIFQSFVVLCQYAPLWNIFKYGKKWRKSLFNFSKYPFFIWFHVPENPVSGTRFVTTKQGLLHVELLHYYLVSCFTVFQVNAIMKGTTASVGFRPSWLSNNGRLTTFISSKYVPLYQSFFKNKTCLVHVSDGSGTRNQPK